MFTWQTIIGYKIKRHNYSRSTCSIPLSLLFQRPLSHRSNRGNPMSWLTRSLAQSLRLDEIDDQFSENDVALENPSDTSTVNGIEEEAQSSREVEQLGETNIDKEEEEAQVRGVKEDFTELKQTLTRQLWGVASFLAPPPLSDDRLLSDFDQWDMPDRSASCEGEESLDLAETSGIGPDLAEIGERISKMASNYFLFGSGGNEVDNREVNEAEYREEELETEEVDDWEAETIGITDEVLAFARNIAMHPETWLDFPLDEEEDLDDFELSDAQREHAFVIEQLSPRLAALRIELCPCHMTEGYFWKVYFVLLHSRLNKDDAEILSTAQVMEARAMWMQELHKQTKQESECVGGGIFCTKDTDNILHEDFGYSRTFNIDQVTCLTTEQETEKHPVLSTEVQFINKFVIEENPVTKPEYKDLLVCSSSKILIPTYEDDDNDDVWPEDDSDLGGYKTTLSFGNEEDVSFSDLEDDAYSTTPIKSKILSKDTETFIP